MKKWKWILSILTVLVLLLVFVGMPYMREQTKKHSPQKTATFKEMGMNLSVAYSSPFKKGREIFGELVPYDVVWRTGANEPTTFTTGSPIKIMGKNLAAGTYSLWTKPGKQSWTVMLNQEIPDWGVTISSGGRDTTRDPQKDVLEVTVPVMEISPSVESFTIDFENTDKAYLSLFWDTTKIMVPISN